MVQEDKEDNIEKQDKTTQLLCDNDIHDFVYSHTTDYGGHYGELLVSRVYKCKYCNITKTITQ